MGFLGNSLGMRDQTPRCILFLPSSFPRMAYVTGRFHLNLFLDNFWVCVCVYLISLWWGHCTLSERFFAGDGVPFGRPWRSVSLAIRLNRCIRSRTLGSSPTLPVASSSWIECVNNNHFWFSSFYVLCKPPPLACSDWSTHCLIQDLKSRVKVQTRMQPWNMMSGEVLRLLRLIVHTNTFTPQALIGS